MINYLLKSTKKIFFLTVAGSLSCVQSPFAQEMVADLDETDTFDLLYGDEEVTSIATGTYKPIHLAPSVATVITAKDIEAMGARNLDEVLEYVPGLHVSISWNRHNKIYSIRGIHTDNNPHVRFLLNGHSIDSVFSGCRPELFRLNVVNISRIEIIRGPGSAVYGADAVSGVINVITKDANDLAGTTVGGRSGSFGTHDVWVQNGSNYLGWDTAFSFEYSKSDGDDKRVVKSDTQTIFDDSFSTFMAAPASLAPGPVSTYYKQMDTSLKLSRDEWSLWFNNWRLLEAGVGPGIAQALDPQGHQEENISSIVLKYKNKEFLSHLELEATLSYNKENQQAYFRVFPPNALLPIGDDGNAFTPGGGWAVFPDGYLGNPGGDIDQTFFEVASTYTRLNSHLIRLALGASYEALKAKSTSNFGPGVIDGTTLSADPFNPTVIDGTLTDTTGTPDIYMPDSNRRVSYLSLQDEWGFAPDWELTAGVRYDHYSDFGGTTNPRLALVWATDYNLTTKLLYGRAFRAPSFNELYITNNPVNLGNRDLNPETLDEAELVFDYRPTFDLRTVFNVFKYELNHLIDYESGQAQNINNQDGYGVEGDVAWKAFDGLDILANYAWQHSEDRHTGKTIADAPARQASIGVRYKVMDRCSVNPQANWVSGRSRASGDKRAPVADYTLVDLTMRCGLSSMPVDLAASIRNVFDEDAREPSPAGAIPDDFPLEGRSFYLEASYRFGGR